MTASPAPAVPLSRVTWPSTATAGSHVAIIAAFVVAGCYGLFVARTQGQVAMIWPASAVGFAAVARYGWRALPALSVAQFLVALIDQRSVPVSLELIAPGLVEPTVAMLLVQRTRLDLGFRRAAATLHLLWIAGVSAVTSAATGVTILLLAGAIPVGAGLTAFASWALGDALGILVFAPAFLLWTSPPTSRSRPAGTERVALWAATLGVSFFVLLTFGRADGYRTIATLLALFPIVFWTGLRADLRTATAIIVVLSVCGTLGVRFGTGALTSVDSARGVLNVQTFHVLMTLVVLVGSSAASQREDTLAQVQEAERKLGLVFAGTPDAIALFSVDPSGTLRLAMANRMWQAGVAQARTTDTTSLVGLTVDEIRTRIGGAAELEPHDSRRLREVAESGAPQTFEHALGPPGHPRIVETSIVALREGARTAYVLSTSRDVTLTRLSERRLRDSELRFAAVSDATTEMHMLFAIEAGGVLRLVHLNRAAQDIWEQFWPGVTRQPIIGRPAADLLALIPGFTPEMYERNVAFVQQAIRERRSLFFEDALTTPRGRRIAEVSVTPIANADGVVTHLLRSSVDITARKEAEDAARRFNEHLERRVAERTAQLASVNKELQAFGYSLSHDLRAPLRSVEGFSRALLEDLDQGHTADLRGHAERILRAAHRMGHLVEDLLRLSQLDTARVHRVPVDLGRIAHEILAELQRGDPGRTVTVRIQSPLVDTGDEQLLTIALQNLLDNAWKYTARQPAAVIEVGQDEVQGVRVTWVRDNGVGFDSRYAGRLFAPFERLHKREDFDGAGIGLATVQRIVAAHGGRVWAESQPGAGATFRFTTAPDAPRPPADEGA